MAIKSDYTPTVYQVADLNSLTGCFIKRGVIGKDDLKVVLTDTAAVVSEGKGVLSDGSIITVDKEGFSLPRSDTSGYIFIADGEIRYGKEADGGLVLAYIDGDVCTDLRRRAYIYSGEDVN